MYIYEFDSCVPEGSKHQTNKGGDCWCEPKILDFGLDSQGNPAKVFVHEGIKEEEAKED